MRCPCRKKSETVLYMECCQPYHAGIKVAPTPETLMRSRYTAFALQLVDYLIATWHLSTCPAQIEFTQDQEWLLLKIIASETDGDTAWVEFTARSRIKGGKNQILQERSRFVRDGGRWLYLDGEIK